MSITLIVIVFLVLGVSSRVDFCVNGNCTACFGTILPDTCYLRKGFMLFNEIPDVFSFINETSYQDYAAIYFMEDSPCEVMKYAIYLNGKPSCYPLDVQLIISGTEVISIRYSEPIIRHGMS